MIVLAGGDLVLPDGVLAGGSLLIEGERIAGVEPGVVHPAGADVRPMAGRRIAPGFIDVHVHGVEGTDVLDGPDAVALVASRLPRYGVTGFCPTAVACEPRVLALFLSSVVHARAAAAPGAAAVLPAHLESNFINPEWSGAQPIDCLRVVEGGASGRGDAPFTGDDILRVMAEAAEHIGIVTIAPELPGGFELVEILRDRGHIVSIGHSGATFHQTLQAIGLGVSHATHLFNRMTPLGHREPGVVGAVLQSPEVAAEIICDGFHVHPAVLSLAVRVKSPARMMAITDGTAASGLPAGASARLGGRRIIAGPHAATLEDGTLAGSVITMDRAFRTLVRAAGLRLDQAARLCATTPAAQLGLPDRGRLAPGARADFVVLGSSLEVAETWIGGRRCPEP